MKVYIIRHAKGNTEKGCWQNPDTPLAKDGVLQANKLAKLSRLRNVNTILTSKLKRSIDTGTPLSKEINVPMHSTELVNERRQVLQIYGAEYCSDIGRKYQESFINSENKIDWKFNQTEESVKDVALRADKFQKMLVSKYLGKNIAVISHDIFIRTFLAQCVLGTKSGSKSFEKIFNSLSTNNCGVTLVEYSETNSSWKMLYFNEFSYLFH